MADSDSGLGDPLLNERQAAEHLGLSVHFLRSRRYRGGGPPFVKVSSRAIRYRPEDLDAWLRERTRRSTSDPGPDAR